MLFDSIIAKNDDIFYIYLKMSSLLIIYATQTGIKYLSYR